MKIPYILSGLLMLAFLLGNSLDAEAQRNKYKKRRKSSKKMSSYKGGNVGARFRPYTFVSGNINALNYFGDLAPVNRAASTDVSFTRPGLGMNLGRRFSPYLAYRFGFNYGRVKGDDVSSDPSDISSLPRYARNLSFRNDIKEFHLAMEVHFVPNYGGPNMRENLDFYLVLGVAVFHHEPKAKVPEFDYVLGGPNSELPAPRAGEWVKLRPLGTEGQMIGDNTKALGLFEGGYSPVQISIPIALGLNFRLPGPFDAGIEFGYRYLFTDYIDDVSGDYVPFSLFDDPLSRLMSDRSLEPVTVVDGVERLINEPGGKLQTSVQTFEYGNPGPFYNIGYIGGGNAKPDEDTEFANRGHKSKDMIFMTTLRISIILGQTRRSAPKFR